MIFKDIKVGDEVFVDGQMGLGTLAALRKQQVTKVTKTTFTAQDTVYLIKNGREKGDGPAWSSRYAYPINTETQEIHARSVAAYRTCVAREKLRQFANKGHDSAVVAAFDLCKHLMEQSK